MHAAGLLLLLLLARFADGNIGGFTPADAANAKQRSLFPP